MESSGSAPIKNAAHPKDQEEEETHSEQKPHNYK